MNINKISIKNFRVFKEKTTFQLRPFTILTGPNNSGKSSFIKFLQLIKNGVFNLSFDKGKHNLENFQNVLNWYNKNDPLEIEIEDDVNSKIIYNYLYDENLSEIEYYDRNNLIFNVSQKKIDYSIDSNKENINCKIFYNLNSLFSQEIRDHEELFHKGEIHFRENNLFFKISYKEEDITLHFLDEIKTFQGNLFDLEFKSDFYQNLDGLLEKVLHHVFSESNIGLKKIIKSHSYFAYYSRLDLFENLKVEFSWLGNQELNGRSKIYPEYGGVYNKILRIIKSLSFVEKELHHLSVNRGSQQRVLMNNSGYEINDIILEFSKRKMIHKQFLLNCFKILGIEGKLDVKRYENTISVVKLIRGDIELSLADLGFGYSQIIPIVLKIHNLMPDHQIENTQETKYEDLSTNAQQDADYAEIQEEIDKKNGTYVENVEKQYSNYIQNNRYFLLEEPEANLHPNLQSNLAELLVYIESVFDIKFIIETHSEYFIRKLQYLTAKEVLSPDDSVIYYFNDDKYVSKTEPKVKEIFINEDGGLTDSFGPGFFDEATKLQFDLIKLNREQLN
jgi:predicted ATPase